MRVEKPFLFFYSYRDYLSNFYSCKIEFEGHVFKSSEHLYMYLKAKYFQDNDIMSKILNAKTPFESKKLGRAIKLFDKSKWELVSSSIMYQVLQLKFEQNTKLRQQLINTGTLWLVEASPRDKLWGIALECGADNKTQSHPDATHPTKWKGRNRLGNILMVLRSHYLSEELKLNPIKKI